MGILLEWLEKHKNIFVEFVDFNDYLRITMTYSGRCLWGRQRMISKKQLDSVDDMDEFLILVLDFMYDQVRKGVNGGKV